MFDYPEDEPLYHTPTHSMSEPNDSILQTHGLVRRRQISSTHVLASFDTLWGQATNKIKFSEQMTAESVFYGRGKIIKINGLRHKKFWFDEKIRQGEEITSFKFNPSKWPTWDSCLSDISYLFEGNVVDGRITGLDNAITIPSSFHAEFDGIDFGRQMSIKFANFGPTDCGYYVGKKGKKNRMKIYDKRLELSRRRNRIDFDCVRLETNFLPESDIPFCQLGRLNPWDPFKNVHRNRLTLIPPSRYSVTERERFAELKAAIEHGGFWWARRQFNRKYQNNFNRMFGSLFRLEPVTPDYSQLFYNGIKDYIGWE